MGKRGSGNGGAGNGRAGRSGGGATGGSAESVKIDVTGLIGSEKQKAYAADILNDHIQKYDMIVRNIERQSQVLSKNKEFVEAAKKVTEQVKTMKAQDIKGFNAQAKTGKFMAGTVIDNRGKLPSQRDLQQEAVRRAGVKVNGL